MAVSVTSVGKNNPGWADRLTSESPGSFLLSFVAGFGRSRTLEIAPLLLVCEVILLSAFLVTGVLLTPPGRFEFDEMRTLIVGGCGVLAIGIQNALMREAFTTFLATNMMTGNFTQFTIDLSNLLRNLFSSHRSKDDTNQIIKRIRRYGNALLGFCCGPQAGPLVSRCGISGLSCCPWP